MCTQKDAGTFNETSRPEVRNANVSRLNGGCLGVELPGTGKGDQRVVYTHPRNSGRELKGRLEMACRVILGAIQRTLRVSLKRLNYSERVLHGGITKPVKILASVQSAL